MMRFARNPRLMIMLVPVLLAALWLAGPVFPEGKKVVGHGPSSQMDIALTFDDGPNPTDTPRILDILDRYNAKGTFFVIGANVKKHPEIARMIVARGHEIANHSMTHSNYLPYRLPFQVDQDYRSAEVTIEKATGVAPRLYRPPHGRITPWMQWSLRRQGLSLVGWSYSPRDWQNPGADKLVQRVVSRAKPGSIFLFHDGLDLNESPNRDQIVQALPTIIEALQAKGYRLVTAGELLGKASYFSR